MERLELGIKSDAIEYRYSYQWLFALMREHGVGRLQLGSSFEMYHLEDSCFLDLRRTAETYGVQIASCFTAHRELGGLLCDDPRMFDVAFNNYRRWMEIAVLVGADYCGSSLGAIFRDQMDRKSDSITRHLEAMKLLCSDAADKGLKALTIEPMSCLAEPPTTSEEIDTMMSGLRVFHEEHVSTTVPVYLCGDISHGHADHNKTVVESNIRLFETGIPYMCEFHFKNTDESFGSTFGFDSAERGRGIVDPDAVIGLIWRNRDRWPVRDLTGYLELPGPKLGRDYSDKVLGTQLSESIEVLKTAMKRNKP